MAIMKNLKDEEIVRIVREKDKELYSEIIKRYQNRLLKYAVYLTQDKDLAADVVQQTFIKAYINLNGFNTSKVFSSWIYRIAHNETMNILNKNHKEFLLNDKEDVSSDLNLEDDIIKKELRNHTQNCLKELPLIYREPLALFFLDERSYEEISDILKIPIGTVATRLNRAKVLMKKICQRSTKTHKTHHI